MSKEIGMVNSSLVRRSLIFALALCLVGLGSEPLSTCSLFSSGLAECKSPKTHSHCDQMNMGGAGSKLATEPVTSCCYISGSSLPESQFEAPELSRTATLAASFHSTGKLSGVENDRPADTVRDLSPPSPQSLLCTFLI